MNLRFSVALLVAFVLSAYGQDPVAAFPKNYTVALENRAVAVIRVHYDPHEKVGVHDHSKAPTIYVYLNDAGPVRFQHFEEHGFELTRPPTAKGGFRVSPGRVERHTVENMGDVSSDFLRVELKQVPLGQLKQGFRGPAPRSVSENISLMEFKNTYLEVRRVVCAGPASCAVEPSPAPSVIVAFTRLRVAGETLEAGAVRWIPAAEGLTIRADTAPAHLLRILIPQTGK